MVSIEVTLRNGDTYLCGIPEHWCDGIKDWPQINPNIQSIKVKGKYND